MYLVNSFLPKWNKSKITNSAMKFGVPVIHWADGVLIEPPAAPCCAQSRNCYEESRDVRTRGPPRYNRGWNLMDGFFFSCDVLKWNLSDWSELWSSCEISVISISHRIHGAGILMLTWLGYIDGIHGTPYIAAPWILWVFDSWLSVRVAILKSKRQRGHHQ